MKVSSAKLRTTSNIFFAYPFLSPIWLLPQLGYTIILWPIVVLCCVTFYLFDRESSLVPLHTSTLDQHPKTHGSKYKRDHRITPSFFFSTNLKLQGSSAILCIFLLSIHRRLQSIIFIFIFLQSQSPLGQHLLLLVPKTFSAHDPIKFDVLTLSISSRVCIICSFYPLVWGCEAVLNSNLMPNPVCNSFQNFEKPSISI